MDSSVKTIIFPVSDVEKAKALFTELLGVQPSADAPYYVGYEKGGQHVGLLPNGKSQGMTGPVSYWHVDDIDRKFAALIAAGATTNQPVTEVGGGRKVASVKDADGNVMGILEDTQA